MSTQDQNTPAPPPTPAPFNFEKYVGDYVKLRDAIAAKEKAHKDELAPFKQLLDDLNTAICSALQSANLESAKTSHGTATVLKKETAGLADKAAFWSYVVLSNDFDLLDYKANVTAVRDHIEKHGTPPPGVNWSTRHVTGIRRPT